MSVVSRIKGGIGADDPYWDALGHGELRITRCAHCSRWIWPAHYRCGDCGSWELEWTPVEPIGTIYSWTRAYFVPDEIRERAQDAPYVAVLVELPGAGRVRVSGVLQGSQEGLRIGASVRGVFLPPSPKSKDYPSLAWELT